MREIGRKRENELITAETIRWGMRPEKKSIFAFLQFQGRVRCPRVVVVAAVLLERVRTAWHDGFVQVGACISMCTCVCFSV